MCEKGALAAAEVFPFLVQSVVEAVAVLLAEDVTVAVEVGLSRLRGLELDGAGGGDHRSPQPEFGRQNSVSRWDPLRIAFPDATE
jgi:hypothetical protein